MEYDKEFAQQLHELIGGEQTSPLRALVPGDWDTVHVFIGPLTEQWIEREVGQAVPYSEYGFDTEGNILVFMHGDNIVRIIGTHGRLLGEGVFSSQVTLRGQDGTIKINDPDPPAQR